MLPLQLLRKVLQKLLYKVYSHYFILSGTLSVILYMCVLDIRDSCVFCFYCFVFLKGSYIGMFLIQTEEQVQSNLEDYEMLKVLGKGTFGKVKFL